LCTRRGSVTRSSTYLTRATSSVKHQSITGCCGLMYRMTYLTCGLQMNSRRMVRSLQIAMLTSYPKFKLVRKSESLLMKLLSFILFFVKDFDTRYTTTIGNTVYMPDHKLDDPDVSTFRTLAHEWVHLHRGGTLGYVPHAVSYLLPQALVVLVPVCGFLFPHPWAWWAVALALLTPWPSWWRMEEELEAYTMSMAVTHWVYGHVSDDSVERIAKLFYGPSYYFMWPFKARILNRLRAERRKVEAGLYNTHYPYRIVRGIIEDEA